MRADEHARIRSDLSAHLDGELSDALAARLDEHVASCPECHAYLEHLRSVRALLRVQPVTDDVPDLAATVMAAVRASGTQDQARSLWVERLRIASVAAAAAALVMFGATLPFGERPADIASADAIGDEVRAAGRALDSYRARFEIVERGWHPDVDVRRLRADVTFKAPESLHLVVSDETAYPEAGWPTNDYELIAGPDRWWIEEHSTCPTRGLPACAAPTTWAGVTERRSVFNRQPFDGTTPLPTDMIVPLETFAADGVFDIIGPDRILDRPVTRVRFDYRHARPLVDALQVGGSWRPFHPLDHVDVWLDRATSFPLRFEVTKARSPDRSAWAQRFGLVEPPSGRLLEVTTTAFERPRDLTSVSFRAPRGGLARDGGFRAVGLAGRDVPLDVPSGFELYRAGRAGAQQVRAYTDGMAYLKVVTQ
ncbi:MAG: anti-sigma factor, partial [Actinomycetota bacterium]|nr:anti-sigma factor [Actinomycetota bacterium]